MSPASLIFAALATVAALVTLITVRFPLSGRLFYDLISRGPTDLKNGLEYLVIVLYAVAFFTLSRRRGWEQQTIEALRTAMLMLVFGELAFTLYQPVRSVQRARACLQDRGVHDSQGPVRFGGSALR